MNCLQPRYWWSIDFAVRLDLTANVDWKLFNKDSWVDRNFSGPLSRRRQSCGPDNDLLSDVITGSSQHNCYNSSLQWGHEWNGTETLVSDVKNSFWSCLGVNFRQRDAALKISSLGWNKADTHKHTSARFARRHLLNCSGQHLCNRGWIFSSKNRQSSAIRAEMSLSAIRGLDYEPHVWMRKPWGGHCGGVQGNRHVT